MTDSLIRYFTVFESTNNLPRTIELGHGENADLIASFKDDGIPVNLSGYTARALYQPRSEWGTDNWYECPCEIVDNTAIAHWGNTYDNGDNAVKMFIHASKDGVVSYPAIYQMKLFETPGFSPGSIVPIQKTLDFSEYNLVNAPWVETEDYTSDIAGIRSDITYLDGVAVKSIEYTGTDKLTVKQFLQANPNAVVIWKADGLGDMTQNIFRRTGVDGEYWTYECYDVGTSQWAWFRITTDWEITVDFILYRSSVAKESDVEDEIADINSKIFDTGIKLIPAGGSGTFTLRNRMLHYVQRGNSYTLSMSLSLPEPDHESFKLFYCTLDVKNIAPNPSQYSSDATITLNQPNGYTWPILVDNGLTLNEVLTIPAGAIARYYISQVGTYGQGGTGNWDALYIRRVLLSDVTPTVG